MAIGAVLRRQVKAAAHRAVLYKLTVLALGAHIMRCQGVYLGNARHVGYKGGTDGPSGAHQVTVLLRVFNQSFGNNIQHAKPVLDNGVQLTLQARGHILRHRIAVFLLSGFPANVRQLIVCAVNVGLEGAGRNGHNIVVDHIGDLVGVIHHHFLGPVTQVGKVLQHLVGGLKVQRRLHIRVLKAFAGHNNGAELGVFFIKKMYIAGSYGQLAQLVADGENFAVNIVQILFFPDLLMNFFIGTQHKSIVAVRLNFQIIIKVGDFLQLFVAFAVENSLVQLALLAGGADNNAVPVLFQRRLQDQRTVLKVLNIALGDMLIQYLAPGQGADQKNNMIPGEVLELHIHKVRVLLVVYQVTLHTAQQLDTGALGCLTGLRQCLHHAVVGDRNRLVAPLGRPLYQRSR